MQLQLDGIGTLYTQLARALKSAIEDGRFVTGKSLPSTRILAQTLGVSRNTVVQAYEILCTEQLVETRGRSGTRILGPVTPVHKPQPRQASCASTRYAARMRALGTVTLARTNVPLDYNLQYGEPLIDLGLRNSWRRKLAAAALSAPLGYTSPAGLPSLRRSLCDYLARRRGIACEEDDILIVAGTQQALTLTARVVLEEGDAAVLEEPHYQLALHSLLAHGAKVVSVQTDTNGLITTQLPSSDVRLICVTPSHQFPSGSILSLNRRVELLDYASRHGCWIFEDDYDSEFQYGGTSLAPLRALDVSDRVIYVGSFSKTLFPSLRLGYIVCPKALRADLFRAKLLDDLGCSAIDQAAVGAFMKNKQFERYLRKSVLELNRRRQALVGGLQRYVAAHATVSDSRVGMHVVVWFKRLTYAQLDLLIERAASEGLGLHPMHPHYLLEKPRSPGLLVGFASLSAKELEAATKLLGKLVREVVRVPANDPNIAPEDETDRLYAG